MTLKRISAHPALYDAEVEENNPPVLKGIRCNACGRVAFPPQGYGCEKCGAGGKHLEPYTLSGQGILSSFAQVNMHQGKDIDIPFVIGEITLKEGPVIRATMVEDCEAVFSSGQSVEGILYPAKNQSSEINTTDKTTKISGSELPDDKPVIVELRFQASQHD